MYMCMYVYVHMYLHLYMYTCVCLCTYVYVCMHVSRRAPTARTRMYACMHGSMHVCMHECMYVSRRAPTARTRRPSTRRTCICCTDTCPAASDRLTMPPGTCMRGARCSDASVTRYSDTSVTRYSDTSVTRYSDTSACAASGRRVMCRPLPPGGRAATPLLQDIATPLLQDIACRPLPPGGRAAMCRSVRVSAGLCNGCVTDV